MKKKDLDCGNVVELKNGNLCFLVSHINPLKFTFSVQMDEYIIELRDIKSGKWVRDLNFDYTDDLINLSDANELSIIKVYEDYTLKNLLWEREDERLLTYEERKWLKAIIKAFNKKPNYILKYIANGSNHFLLINACEDNLVTPCLHYLSLKFENLEVGKKYSLDELGL